MLDRPRRLLEDRKRGRSKDISADGACRAMKENNLITWLNDCVREEWQKQLFVQMMSEYQSHLDDLVPGGCPETFNRED